MDVKGCGLCHRMTGVAPLQGAILPVGVAVGDMARAIRLAPDLRYTRDRWRPSALVAWLIEGSRWGFAWRAVKDDPVAARSLAVRIFPSKMAAAAISGALTGIGGAIYAQYVGYIDPDSVMYGQLSILIPLPAILGGVGTLWGPLVGAAVWLFLQDFLQAALGLGAAWKLVLGIVFVDLFDVLAYFPDIF